jgi:Uma2 family endonuclease
MTSEPKRRYSVEDYLALERQAERKSEYLDGEIFAMAGTSRKHGLVAGNVFAALHAQLRDRECEAFTADMRVRIPATDLFTYPDIVVVCGEPRFDDEELDILLNPTLIVEVLSPTTADYDRGTKFAHYRTLPSLREYLLLAQDRVHAEHWLRQEAGSWLFTETDDASATLGLPSIGCRLPLAEAYAKVGL